MDDFVMPEIDVASRKIVTATIEGILEEEDLLGLLGSPSPRGESSAPSNVAKLQPTEPPNLKRIKERHHGVARLVASGMSQTLVASITNYNEQYLCVLLNSPAMQELVALYRLQHGKSAEIITEKLRTVGTEALSQLGDKLENEDLSPTDLVAIAKLGLDRTGHGPASTQNINQVNNIIDHAEITRLNIEARKKSSDYIIPVREVRAALPKPEEEKDEDS